MNPSQVDQLLAKLERIASALELLAKDSGQRMAWDAGSWGIFPEEPSDQPDDSDAYEEDPISY